MPSVTDIQQQSTKISSDNNGKSTPPPTQQQQQQQISSASNATTTDLANADPITQAVLMLEKKQRNLGKRKEKLESYQQEAKSGKELNKDQKDALSKYAEVLGQIECAKDICEQLKKIQSDSAKNQKRLSKQAAEEKRLLVAQRLREYAQLRYLLDHRPATLKAEESSLLDELARVVVPSDGSSNTITRSVDLVLSIYQGGPLSSTIKNLTGRTSQEVRETLEQMMKQWEMSSSSSASHSSSSAMPLSSSSDETLTPQQIQLMETVKQTPLVPQAPPTTPASLLPQREQTKQQSNNPNDVLGSSLSHTHLVATNPNDYVLQLDTREQNIPLQQILQNSPFISLDPTNTTSNQQIKQDSSNNPDNTSIQSNEINQFSQPFAVLNPNLTSQVASQDYTQTSSVANQQQGITNYDQENASNIGGSGHVPSDEQQSEEQWQQSRSTSGHAHRTGHYNGSGNKPYNRGGSNNYNQQQWRGPRGGGGHYDNSYRGGGGGQRQYNENNNRGGGGGGHRGGPNPNYRGNRGGNYRGGNRGGSAGSNGNEYQKSSQYQQSHEQQVRSAPPKQHQQQ